MYARYFLGQEKHVSYIIIILMVPVALFYLIQWKIGRNCAITPSFICAHLSTVINGTQVNTEHKSWRKQDHGNRTIGSYAQRKYFYNSFETCSFVRFDTFLGGGDCLPWLRGAAWLCEIKLLDQKLYFQSRNWSSYLCFN